MRSFQHTAHLLWAISLIVIASNAGCTKPTSPTASSSVTAGPAVTSVPAITAAPPAPIVENGHEDVTVDLRDPSSMERLPENNLLDSAPAGKLVAIDIQLPAPAFRGTPVPSNEPNVAKPLGKAREPFLAPEGTVNLAAGKPVTSSDPAPTSGETDFVTDGDKEASDFGYLELRPGAEWIQIDLGETANIYAIVVWHNHADARVYRDVIVEISDDPDFLDGQVVFNNDYDNSSGMGVGPDMGYVETSEGCLIDCGGYQGRYVRLHSNGNIIDAKNHYTEVEVYGKPVE